jgi:hypothetical protein
MHKTINSAEHTRECIARYIQNSGRTDCKGCSDYYHHALRITLAGLEEEGIKENLAIAKKWYL